MATCSLCGTSENVRRVKIAGRYRRSYLCEDCQHRYYSEVCECCGGHTNSTISIQVNLTDEGIVEKKCCGICANNMDLHWCPECGLRHTAPYMGCGSDFRAPIDLLPTHIADGNASPWRDHQYSPDLIIDVFGRESEDHPFLCWKHMQEYWTKINSMEYGQCVHCTERTSSKNSDGQFVCKHCQRHMRVCKDCGSSFPSTCSPYGGQGLCATCASKYTRCEYCGVCYLKSESHKHIKRVEGRIRCTKCLPDDFDRRYILCECGNYHLNDLEKKKRNFIRQYGGAFLVEYEWDTSLQEFFRTHCQNCINKSVGYCTTCNKLIVGGVLKISEGGAICVPCYANKVSPPILSYSEKSILGMYGSNSLKYGAEIELEFSDSAAHSTARTILKKHVPVSEMYYKHDGSLSTGFEAVTMPMDFDYFMGCGIGAAIDEMASTLGHKFRNNCVDSAGLHIHMSKKAFTSLQLLKFLDFFNEYTEFVEVIARRKAKDYCKKFTDYRGVNLRKMAKDKGGTEKYTMVNLRPEYTIEIRIFKGVWTSDQLFYSLQFLDALFNLTRISTLKSPPTPDLLIAYVSKHKKIYPHLNKLFKATA